MKTIRLILSLTILLSSFAGASGQRAQRTAQQLPAASGATAPSAQTPTQTPTPIPGASGVATGKEIFSKFTPSSLSRQGVLVETLDGKPVREQYADQAFNPASAVKLATAFAALKTFGPKHRFATTFWVTGAFDNPVPPVAASAIAAVGPSTAATKTARKSRTVPGMYLTACRNPLGLDKLRSDLWPRAGIRY